MTEKAFGIGQAIDEITREREERERQEGEVVRIIGKHIIDYLAGGPDLEVEDIELARSIGADLEVIGLRWKVVRKKREANLGGEASASLKNPEIQPRVEDSKIDVPKIAEPKLRRLEGKPNASSIVKPIEAAIPKLSVIVKPTPAERRYNWTDVTIPKGASDIETLTYVPGLVGQFVEWTVAGARRPNRVMALGVGLTVVGTLIGRRVEGPTGTATHLYVFILAPTGWGKDYPLWCGNRLMIEVGAQSLLGPNEFVSGRGLIKFLKRNPLALFIVDELGDVFQLINAQQDNPWVTDLMGHFKKLYNSWEIINTAESMKDQSVTINHPAVSIVGACTPQALFEALKPRDIEGGFANRAMLLPFEGFKRPPERDVPEGAEEPPAKLVEELKELWGPQRSILDRAMSAIDVEPPVQRGLRQQIRWGSEEAKAAYFAFSREIDQWQDKDKRKFELGMRAAENAVRCATDIAAGCFSPTVDLPDIEWGLKWSRVSYDAAVGGVEKYMRDYYEFPKFCERVLEFISQEGFVSERELGRAFRRNMKFGHELDRALKQLGQEGHIHKASRQKRTGPASEGWEVIE